MSTLQDATVHVFTFKEGLLSTVAHDLRLSLTRFEVRVDGDAIEVVLWPDSLRVDGSVKGGRLEPSGLSEKDKAEIVQNACGRKILDVARWPEVRYRGRRTGDRVDGTLSLAGRDAPLGFSVREDAGRVRGRLELAPSRWGIAPYKALLGAIRLKDRVVIDFDVAG